MTPKEKEQQDKALELYLQLIGLKGKQK